VNRLALSMVQDVHLPKAQQHFAIQSIHDLRLLWASMSTTVIPGPSLSTLSAAGRDGHIRQSRITNQLSAINWQTAPDPLRFAVLPLVAGSAELQIAEIGFCQRHR
jgi:hypothetical protein